MIDFGPAVILGLCFGFLCGIGCSLAIMYSIYLGGYRKAVEESLATVSRFAIASTRKTQARQARKRLPSGEVGTIGVDLLPHHAPPFITKLTCSTAVMSSSGLPGTATMSA